MPKQKSKNPFYFFMLEWKKSQELQGRKFPNGIKDVQADPDCNATWQSLSKEHKHVYETMAKKDKITSQKSINKMTLAGESLQLLEKEQNDKKKFIAEMDDFLKLTIARGVTHNILPQLKFCFVCVNWFYTKFIDNKTDYFPAEYTVGIFSLENGIEDIHHEIVSTQIPLGYLREALETSQNTHNIPIEYPGEESNFAVMYEKLINFLEPRKIMHKYPPLYTKRCHKDVVESLLRRLCDAAQQDMEEFLVYDIESLFKNLADEIYKKRTDRQTKYTSVYAECVFKDLRYIYKKGYECDFHRYVEGGSEYCSTSVLYQWAWSICKEFCAPLEICMKPGLHHPENAENSDFFDIKKAMSHLNITSKVLETTPDHSLLSMTGVSEQHRRKVSEITYEEKILLRMKAKPVEVIDYSELNHETEKPTESHKEEENNLQEKSIRPPNIKSYVAIMDDNVPKNDEINFPPMVGRGALHKLIKDRAKKQHVGKGHGSTDM